MTYSLITVNRGHSPKSPGASGNGYKEHEVAELFKNKLFTALKGVGQKVADTTSNASTSSAVLVEQVKRANAHPKAGRLDVSIHLNAATDKTATGVEVLYFSEKDLSARVSKTIATTLGLRDRGAKERKDLYFLKNSHAPAILIELCFISNATDMKALMAKMDETVHAVVKVLTGKSVSTPVEKPKNEGITPTYRVIVEGKQVGAFKDPLTAIENELKKHPKEIIIQKI